MKTLAGDDKNNHKKRIIQSTELSLLCLEANIQTQMSKSMSIYHNHIVPINIFCFSTVVVSDHGHVRRFSQKGCNNSDIWLDARHSKKIDSKDLS